MISYLKSKLLPFGGLHGLFDCDCACAQAPNYEPVAAASKEAAEISAQLGREQLAENRRQYEKNFSVSKPVVDAQLALMNQSKQQGDDYYNYLVSRQRPVEDALNREALNTNNGIDNTERANMMARVNSNAAADEAERSLITGGQRAIYNARKNDIEYQVGNAVADARAGATSSNNAAIRQALRYGMSAAQIAKALGTSSLTSAQQVVAAGNNARNLAIDNAKVDLSNAYNMRNQTNNNILSSMQADRSMRLQTDSTNWAKKLDVAGLYRGLPGASQGAYSTSINAGNSAVSNQNTTAAQYLNGINAGTNTITSGLGMQLSGLGNVLNSQTSFANGLNSVYSSQAANYQSPFSQIMGGAGAVAGLATAFSDRRLKENIVLVGRDESGRFNLYEFTYIGSPGQKFIGVMADEVEPLVPEAVVYDDLGYASVNYEMIGVPFKEIENATA